jgi:ParB family chromosome partitioning protein
MERSYVYGVAHLIEKGEEDLVKSIDAGRLPLSVAVEIAAGDDQAVSRALSEAYEKGDIRGRHISLARRIITQRIAKNRREGRQQKARQTLTGETLVREYKQKIRDQKALIAKADHTREHLLLLISAVRKLLSDENFTNLLKAEGLQQMPAELASRLQRG